MNRQLLPVLALTMSTFGATPPAHAQGVDNVVKATVLQGWRMQNGNHMSAIRFKLAPGWKTYWRAPGDAGIPPRFAFAGSENLADVEAHWPVPDVYYIGGFRSVGYADEVLVPIEFTPKDPDAPLMVDGEIEIGVCEEVCIPVSLRFQAALDGEITAPNGDILAALADKPMTAKEAGVVSARCSVRPISDGLELTAQIEAPRLGSDEEAVIEFADPEVWVSVPDFDRAGSVMTLVADLVPPTGKPFILSRADVRFTILSEGRAVDIQGCQAAN